MRIWIDLAAPPQVLFFRPIWQMLRDDGHALLLTVRDFARAPEIARQHGMPHAVIGHHGGLGTARKGAAIMRRAAELVRSARRFGPDVAVSHNSYAQAVAAALLRVPLITAMDYEHQPANHLSFRVARRVVVPDAFPAWALRKYGAAPHRVVHYPGVKEEVYLADFQPDPHFRERLGVPDERILVTMRPPARSAMYHRFDNPLFEPAVERVSTAPNTHVIVLDRTATSSWSDLPNVQVPAAALDGPNLVYASDVVVGAGGTMNREAAVLGTPVYSLYAGRESAVDDYLVAAGRMSRVSTLEGLSQIAVRKKSSARLRASRDGLQRILDSIVTTQRA